MAAGRIKIMKHQYTMEGGRRKEIEPIEHHACWCDIKNLYGNELYKALEIRLENTIIFEVRHCKKIKEMQQHLKEFFVEYEGEKYDIFASDYKQNDRQYVQLKANRTA